MWAVFYCANGANYHYLAFEHGIFKLLDEPSKTNVFYGAFVKEADAKRIVDLINSASF